MMSFAFSETSSLRHLQNSIDFFGHYLTMAQVVVVWVTHHPYWAVAIALFTLSLIHTVLSLISEALRQGLRWLLQLPWQTLHWGIVYGWQSGRRLWLQPAPPALDTPMNEQITTILQRLETLRQEQENLMRDLETLLAVR
jgi:hypothetical protein